MPFRFDERSAEDPRGSLQEFLYDLRKLLRNLVFEIVEGFDFRPDLGEHRDIIGLAVNEADERGFFARATRGVREVSADALDDTGLSGSNLTAKLVLLTSFSQQLRNGFRKAIKYILELANKLLGSIKAALGAVGGAVIDGIAELKDIIKAKIEFVNGW